MSKRLALQTSIQERTSTHHAAHLDCEKALAFARAFGLTCLTFVEGRRTAHTASYWYRHCDRDLIEPYAKRRMKNRA